MSIRPIGFILNKSGEKLKTIKSLKGSTLWTTASTAVKIAVGLLVVKLLAEKFGASGLGQAANFMTLITVLGTLSGAGIFNGVTKYVAEYEHDPEKLDAFLSTSNRIIVLFSAALAVVFVLFSGTISECLFYRPDYRLLVIATGIIQFGIALGNYFLAVLKGYRNAKANAVSLILGTLAGLFVFLVGFVEFDYQGALFGLAVIPALSFLPAAYFLQKRMRIQAVDFWQNFTYFSEHGRSLFKFSLMVFITAVTLPLSYVLLRNLLVEHHSLEAVGWWQGVSKISDAYLQFITAGFSVYLLPTFSKLTDKNAIRLELGKALKFVSVLAIWSSLTIFACKRWLILTFYSGAFLPMEELFLWQLLGDLFKVMAYVFGYLVVARASIKLYALAEAVQFGLLLGFGSVLIPLHGAIGATQTYLVTYLCYFLCCLIAFHWYMRK